MQKAEGRMKIGASLRRLLLLFCHRPPILKFRPESADAFGACAWIPAKTRAKKFVLLVTFQAEPESFFVELPKFHGIFHFLGLSFGKNRALTPVDANAMETGNGVPADVPLGVK